MHKFRILYSVQNRNATCGFRSLILLRYCQFILKINAGKVHPKFRHCKIVLRAYTKDIRHIDNIYNTSLMARLSIRRVPVFLRKPIDICDFPGEGDGLDPKSAQRIRTC